MKMKRQKLNGIEERKRRERKKRRQWQRGKREHQVYAEQQHMQIGMIKDEACKWKWGKVNRGEGRNEQFD